MRRLERAAAGVIALCASGCASVSAPPRTADDLPPAFRNAARLADATTPSTPEWWRAFGDETLDALEARALRGNPGLIEAGERIRAARLLERPAAARFRPNLQAHTTSAPNVESTASYFQAGFDAQWELGLFGKAGAERRIASITTDEAAIERDAARLSVGAELAREYLTLRYAQRSADLAQRAIDAAEGMQRLARSRRRLGLGTDADLARAAQGVLTTRQQLDDTTLRAERSIERIAVLCGSMTPPPELDRAGDPPALPPPPAPRLPAELLRRRPDLRRAEAEMRKAAAELDLARAERWPQIVLVGDITYAAKIDGDELLSPRRLQTFGPGISIPLFDWGARAARAHARGAALAASGMAYRAAVLEAVAETESSLATYGYRARRSELAASALEAQASLERTTERREALGLADETDVLGARQQTLGVEASLLAARMEQADGWIALHKALGGSPEATP